jgi:hypothetical protein
MVVNVGNCSVGRNLHKHLLSNRSVHRFMQRKSTAFIRLGNPFVFFLTPIIDGLLQQNYEQVVCQRGCRFFNIIHFKDELNLNVTRKECHLCRYLLHRFRFTKRLLLQLAMSRMLWLKKMKSACKAAI